MKIFLTHVVCRRRAKIVLSWRIHVGIRWKWQRFEREKFKLRIGFLGEILFLKFLLKCSKNGDYFIVKNSYWNSIKRNDFATGSSSNYLELWVGFLEVPLRGLKILRCSKNKDYFIVKNSYWNSIKRNDFATGSSSNYFELWVGFLEIPLRGLNILRCSKNKDYFIAKDSHRN